MANSLGVPAVTRIASDPAGANGSGILKGRAVVNGPGRNEVSLSADGSGTCAGVAIGSRKHGQDIPIQSEGFADVESFGAVGVGVPVFVSDAEGRVGAAALGADATPASGQGLRLGTSTSATDAQGERLTVDLSARGA